MRSKATMRGRSSWSRSGSASPTWPSHRAGQRHHSLEASVNVDSPGDTLRGFLVEVGALFKDDRAMFTTAKLPLAPKLLFTGFMAVLVPVYWYHYGPTNFL